MHCQLTQGTLSLGVPLSSTKNTRSSVEVSNNDNVLKGEVKNLVFRHSTKTATSELIHSNLVIFDWQILLATS